jgi:DNA-binding SARP family transcriptional activator
MSSVVGRRNGAAPAARNGRRSLSLLNAFELRFAGERVSLPVSAQRLLAFVALQERPVQRVYVAGMLWADASEERAGASLRSSLWRLHRSGHRLVDATSAQLRLASDVDVDVRRASELAHKLIDGSAVLREATPSSAMLTGELLPDWYDDWVLFERERFRQLWLHALEALAEQRLATGQLGPALETALALVGCDPLRESGHRLLIRVHLAEGNGAEALRQYELCRRLLRDRLGLEPSRQLDELLAVLSPRSCSAPRP